MKKTENLNDWLARVTASPKNVDAIHFDGLAESKGKQISGLELAPYSALLHSWKSGSSS
jgi:hypothetical protein